MLTQALRPTLLRIKVALLALGLVTVLPSQGKAASFEVGEILGLGFMTFTSPPNLNEFPGSFASIKLTAGFDFGSGGVGFKFSGSTITATCRSSSPCTGFQDLADPRFFSLAIADNMGPGDQLDNILNVSAVDAPAVYFNSNVIVLDLSGLTFAGNQTRTLATVQFGPATSEVPLPAALPLFASGLAALGFVTWRKRRKVTAV